MSFPSALEKLVKALGKLPGIGPKTAMRLAFFLLFSPKEEVSHLAKAMLEAKERVGRCSRCGYLAEDSLCAICQDPKRDRSLLCVVQDPRDVAVLEKAGAYNGTYFVLHGALSPIEGIGPEELHIPRLLKLIEEEKIKELIVATNPNVEGDATALYLSRQAKPLGVKVTRIAFGLPVGGDLEYADALTLSRALEGRREI